MTIIELKAIDQKLCTATEPIVAAGDKKSTKIHVEFSDEWAGYAKTAVFFASKDVDDVIEQVMTGDACEIPHEVIDVADNLFIGVRGVIASTGAVKTSTLVKYKIEEGAPAGTGTTVPPTADVYQQLLSKTTDLDKRLSNLLNGLTEDDEVKDVRVGADDVTYTTAGEAVRTQFRNLINKHEVDNEENKLAIRDVKEELHGIRLGADGVTYETAGEAVRTQFSDVGVRLERFEGTANIVTLGLGDNDRVSIQYGRRLLSGNYRIGDMFGFDNNNTVEAVSYYLYTLTLNEGEIFSSNSKLILSNSNYPNIIVTDIDHVIKKIIPYEEMNNGGTHAATEYEYLYICFSTPSVSDLFYIKKTIAYEPLVLDADLADEYTTNSTIGDEALNAILRGRQILVRVPNADGGNYTAIYSPVYMYQLPNHDNNYLYIFYLRDEKKLIDLSAMGMGKIEMPTYGQLKMLLPKTYNEDPLN